MARNGRPASFTAVSVGMEPNHLPGRQGESNYDTFVDPRTASPGQGGCLCAWLPPGLAEEPEYVQQISKGHSCIQFQSRWVIALFVGVRHSSPHIRGRAHLAAVEAYWRRYPGQAREGARGPSQLPTSNLETPCGHCSTRPRLRESKLRLKVSRGAALLIVAQGRRWQITWGGMIGF